MYRMKKEQEGANVASVNHVLLHDINTGEILRTIQELGPISRSEIAKHISLAQSTVSVITGELMEKSLIRECGRANSTGGRRRLLLEINPAGGHFICADLSSQDFQIGVLDISLNIHKLWNHSASTLKGEELYEYLEKAISRARDWCIEQQLHILGVGVSTPGLVDSGRGVVIEANNLGWYELDLGARLESKFQYHVVVENDANAAGYGEYKFGNANETNIHNLLYVYIGFGTGSGIILNGSPFTGSFGVAGEIGHIMVDANGPKCTCGKRGCLESYASIWAIVNEYAAARAGEWSPDIGITDVLKRADEHEPDAHWIVSRAGSMAGMTVGNQVNVLNVERITVSGIVPQSQVMWTAFTTALEGALMPTMRRGLEVRPARLGTTAGLIGVASLNFARLVESSDLFA